MLYEVITQQALPKAAYIGFTGTPLLKDDKTENKFGKIIHSYTMQQAVEDRITSYNVCYTKLLRISKV